jgi:hypothetical protein
MTLPDQISKHLMNASQGVSTDDRGRTRSLTHKDVMNEASKALKLFNQYTSELQEKEKCLSV